MEQGGILDLLCIPMGSQRSCHQGAHACMLWLGTSGEEEEFHSPQINELELKSPWVRKLIRADHGRGPELAPFPVCGLCQHKAGALSQ